MQLNPYHVPFNGYQIKTLSVKETNAIALSTNGVVFTWGKNANIVSVDDRKEFDNSYHPVIMQELYQHKDVIVNVDCGNGFFVVITSDAYNLLTWGYKSTYSHNNTSVQRISGMHLGLARKIHQISCSDSHTLCLLTSGTVYYWGSEQHIPKQIPNIPFIRHISSGYTHHACIDIHGNLYVWGVIKPNILNQSTPMLLGESNDNTQYINVKCGIDSLVVLDNLNNVYAWGKNTCKKLYNSDHLVLYQLTKLDWI